MRTERVTVRLQHKLASEIPLLMILTVERFVVLLLSSHDPEFIVHKEHRRKKKPREREQKPKKFRDFPYCATPSGSLHWAVSGAPTGRRCSKTDNASIRSRVKKYKRLNYVRGDAGLANVWFICR